MIDTMTFWGIYIALLLRAYKLKKDFCFEQNNNYRATLTRPWSFGMT